MKFYIVLPILYLLFGKGVWHDILVIVSVYWGVEQGENMNTAMKIKTLLYDTNGVILKSDVLDYILKAVMEMDNQNIPKEELSEFLETSINSRTL